MAEANEVFSVKGERSLSQGFVSQYAAEAALQVDGVASLDTGLIVSLKEALGGEHEGKGVRVRFSRDDSGFVNIDVYPLIYYGYILPDVAWQIQERVKEEVEQFTGLIVNEVNVQVMGVLESEDME